MKLSPHYLPDSGGRASKWLGRYTGWWAQHYYTNMRDSPVLLCTGDHLYPSRGARYRIESIPTSSNVC